MSLTLDHKLRSAASPIGVSLHPDPRKSAAPREAVFKDNLIQVIPALRAFARSLCRNQTLADDLVQETLLKAWSGQGTYDPSRSLKSWAFSILHNVYHSEGRKSRRLVVTEPLDDYNAGAAGQTTDTVHTAAVISRAIQALPIHQQEALILIAACGFSYGDAAKVTGVPIGTIKSRVCRARTSLTILVGQV